MFNLLYFRQCISWPNVLSSSYSQNSFPPCTLQTCFLSLEVTLHYPLPSFCSNQNKGTMCFHEWIGAAFCITSLKSHLTMVLLLPSSKIKITFFMYRHGRWKNPWCLCNIPSGFLEMTLSDKTFCDSSSQRPTSCKHLSTAVQKQASTEDAMWCVLLNHSQAPLPSLWEKSAKATACLPRLWLIHSHDVTAQAGHVGEQQKNKYYYFSDKLDDL